MSEEAYLSKEKIKELEKEVSFLSTRKRKEVADKLEYAKSLGDLSENTEYQEAREDQANLEKRILYVRDVLDRAVVVEKKHSNIVEVGSSLVIRREENKIKKEIEIVGSEEADFSIGKISLRSPLGDAVVGKKKGDIVLVKTPKGKIEYKIIDVK